MLLVADSTCTPRLDGPGVAGEAAASSSDDEWEEVETPKEYDALGFRADPELEALARAALGGGADGRRQRAHLARWTEGGALAELEAGRPERARELARAGVPSELRCRVWRALSGADELRALHAPDHFAACAARGAAARTDATSQIELDLARTFPGHRLFETAEGAALLRRVLTAFAQHDAHIGCARRRRRARARAASEACVVPRGAERRGRSAGKACSERARRSTVRLGRRTGGPAWPPDRRSARRLRTASAGRAIG